MTKLLCRGGGVIARLVGSSVAVFGLLLPAACGGSPPASGPAAPPGAATTAPAPSAPASSPSSLPDIIAQVEPSVVTVMVPQGLGSGVVYRGDIVVTNQHVVGDASQVTLQFADGTLAPGQVLAADRISDLAVIRSARGNLPPLRVRTDLPRQGETALALGSPLGLENTATAGIVSAVGRELPGTGLGVPTGLIQTDAPISPGNSGGALVDAGGALIGINEIYIPPRAGAVALGFAIPSATVTEVADQLLTRGVVTHPYLGVGLTTLTPAIRDRLGVAARAGALVVDLAPRSPADQAGLHRGDVITAFAGQPVTSVQDVTVPLSRTRPGQVVPVTVARGTTTITVTVTIGERPPS